jgi:two-component system chemotaxis response regulator CheB
VVKGGKKAESRNFREGSRADFPAAIVLVRHLDPRHRPCAVGDGERRLDGSATKKMGGTVIVQDMKTSEFFGMPGAAIQSGPVDFTLPPDQIPGALVTLVMRRGFR